MAVDDELYAIVQIGEHDSRVLATYRDESVAQIMADRVRTDVRERYGDEVDVELHHYHHGEKLDIDLE